MEDLKEPLIQKKEEKENRTTWLQDTYMLDSYREQKKEGLLSTQWKAPEEDAEQQQPNSYERVKIDQIPIDDFKDIYVDSYVRKFEGVDQQFYNQTVALHKMPTLEILSTSICRSNPNIFAVFSRNTFDFEEIKLYEYMEFEDYKKLEVLRIRNYITIIKMLYRIYYQHAQQEEKFQELRTKLLQIQSLLKFLYIHQNYSKMYEKLKSGNNFIFTLSENNRLIDDDLEAEDNQYDSDEEYQNFYAQSSISHYSNTGERSELHLEEEKWKVRATWLESVLQTLMKDQDLIKWHAWFQAKLGELVQLDIKIDTGSSNKSSKVFYVYDWLDKQQTKFDPNVEYEPELMIQQDQKNIYPKIHLNTNDLGNNDYPILKCQFEIREKLGLKIQRREIDTQYILTVFERKEFGNEKIYEKRINTRGKSVYYARMDFHPSGNYLKMAMDLSREIQMIFPLKAQFKDPLLIRPESTMLKFQEKYFYATCGNRLYQYDLYDYDKVKSWDLCEMIKNWDNGYKVSFDRVHDGFAYIRKKTEMEGQAEKIGFSVWLKGEEYNFDPSEKVYTDTSTVNINQKGSQVLVSQWKEGQLLFIKFSIDPKSTNKILKKDGVIPLQNKEYFQIDKKTIEYKVVPLYESFGLIFKVKGTKVYVFQDQMFITQVVTTSWDYLELYHSKTTGNIKMIYIFDEDYRNNNIKYEVISEVDLLQEKRKVWQQELVLHPILNKHYSVQYPYLTFFYNHDQVYMKDLTKPANEGFYYMNNFLGIDQKTRPLTSYGIHYSNKFVMCVPTINSNYSKDNFVIKIHSVKTKYEHTQRTKFSGLVRYRIYAINQELIQQQLQNWFSSFLDSRLNLQGEIRVVFKHNCLSFEKWVSRKCKARFITFWYNSPIDPERNISSKDQDMQFKSFGQWGFMIQKENEVQFYTATMRYNFHIDSFKSLEAVWSIETDDQTEEIYDIMIDNMVKDQLDIYLLFSTGQMRRFTTKLEYGKQLIESFVDDPNIYSIEPFFKNKGGQVPAGDKSGGGGAKKIDLWDFKQDIFVANRLLYMEDGVVDLSAIKPQEKVQTGFQLTGYIRTDYNSILKLTFSQNEAKVACIFALGTYSAVVIMPLFNARQLPLFLQNSFVHPVVPQIDQLKGYTSVFTLYLKNQYHQQFSLTHERWKQIYYKFMKNMSPGFVIKYFNGLEKHVPLSDFGEVYKDIIRFNQSADGKFLTIMGTRFGPLEDVKTPLTFYGGTMQEENSGIFVYEVSVNSITMKSHFLFAEKDTDLLKYESRKKQDAIEKFKQNVAIATKMEQERQYVKKEIEQFDYNEYNMDYQQEKEYYATFFQSNYDFTSEIDISLYDEERKMEELIEQYRKEIKAGNDSTRRLTFFGNSDALMPSEEELREKAEEDDAYKSIVKIRALREKFPGFDIPYLQTVPDEVKKLIDQEGSIYMVSMGQEEQLIKEKEAERIKLIMEEEQRQSQLAWDKYYADQKIEQEKYEKEQEKQRLKDEARAEAEARGEEYVEPPEEEVPPIEEEVKVEEAVFEEPLQLPVEEVDEEFQLYTEQEKEKVAKTHQNMIFSVNDQGHIILLERLHNKLYFFYQQDDVYQLQKIRFDKDFKVQGVEASQDYLVVYNQNRFQVYDIRVNGQPAFTLRLDSKSTKVLDKATQNKITENYEQRFLDIKIKDSLLILRVQDNTDFKYLTCYDINRKLSVYYHEGENVVISGDGSYLWLLESNQVFNLFTGITTFFMWPGDQIATPQHDSMDLFNVTPDRSIMITQGYLQLAFNQISMYVDEDLAQNGIDFKSATSIINKSKRYEYLFYKIGNNQSVLERIFKEDRDKNSLWSNWEELETPETEKQVSKRRSAEMKKLSYLLNYFQDNVPLTDQNKPWFGNFFLSYYHLKKDAKDPKNILELNIFEKMYSLGRDKRPDIVEDILFYAVQSDNVNLQYVISTCFLDFLDTANSSQSFQDYLKNITKQTSKMQEIEKFQIESTDEGFVVDCHNSPIMDNGFQASFRVLQEPKKDVEIYYVYLNNLLNEQGKDIMDTLSDEKYLPMMDIPFIQYLVMYQWRKVRSTIQLRLLIPFFCLLTLFFIYATFQIDWYRTAEIAELDALESNSTLANSSEGQDIAEELEKRINFHESFAWIMNVIGLIIILFYLYIMEIKQFIKNPSDYVVDFWNMADIINYTLCSSVILMDITNADIVTIRPIASICVIILWIKMFYFLRVFETTSRLIRMIIEIVSDMKNFLIVLLIGILGFANGFYILSQNQNNGLDPFAGSTFSQSVIYTYRMTLGDFSTDDFYSLSQVDVYIVWFIFIIASLFVCLVLLNLLIAIMGDTFGRVLENITNLTIREKVKLVAENEALFDRNVTFVNSQYLIVIKEKNLEALQSENWDGQMNALKKQMMDKMTGMETNFEGKLNEGQAELRRRFQDFDEKSKKAQSQTETRVTVKVKEDLDQVVNKVQDLFHNMSEKISVQNQIITSQQEQMKALNMVTKKVEGLMTDQNRFRDLMYKHFSIDPSIGKQQEEEE